MIEMESFIEFGCLIENGHYMLKIKSLVQYLSDVFSNNNMASLPNIVRKR